MAHRNGLILITRHLILSAVLAFSAAGAAFSQEYSGEENLNPRTGFPEIEEKPFIMLNEGIAFTQINRIEINEARSNFVREDYLIGAYFAVQTKNLRPVDSIGIISVYYPFYHTFNGMRQTTKQILLYAVDLFYAPFFETDMWKYVRLKFAPGLHTTYQLTDEYHMLYFGMEILLGAELPAARCWTVLVDGMLTVDYANLGSNRIIQPFDYAWQYRLNAGVRYSRKGINKFAYLEGRRKSSNHYTTERQGK